MNERRKRKVLDPLRTFERYCVIYNVSTIYHLFMIVCNKCAYPSHWLLCYCSWMLVVYQFDIWEWKESRYRRSGKCSTNAQWIHPGTDYFGSEIRFCRSTSFEADGWTRISFPKKIKCLGGPAVQSVSLTFSGRLESSVDVFMTTYGRFSVVSKTFLKRFKNVLETTTKGTEVV